VVGQPGSETLSATFEMETALRVLTSASPSWPEGFRDPFQAELKTILNATAEAAAAETPEPLLGPPIYGEWYAARHTVNPSPSPTPSHPWLDVLNLAPRPRAGAPL